jgi:hypothetical protein
LFIFLILLAGCCVFKLLILLLYGDGTKVGVAVVVRTVECNNEDDGDVIDIRSDEVGISNGDVIEF